jgi:hypothetical protein
MIYLNEPVAGGATRFVKIDKMVQPRRESFSPGTTRRRKAR